MQSKSSSTIRFLSLGGAGEIGMNLNLYEYGGKWLMVDCGITFSNDKIGIDVITPDPSYILERKKNLIGLVLTHAHEDHIGAIPFLWSKFKCPLYATPFTAAIIKQKLQRFSIEKNVKINIIPLKGTFQISHFHIEYITVTHSIPEPNALAITTPAGTIIHTGDWKLDQKPLIGELTDKKRLKELGQKGVLALICDSTNANIKGHSLSESNIRKNLINIIKSQKKLVAIASFASNITRLESAAIIGKISKRQVILIGFSLWNMYKTAKEVGYLKNIKPFIKIEEAQNLKKNQILIVCTGSQGEEEAALNKISKNQHKKININNGDTVIFSSRVIPGNEEKVRKLQLRLEQKGVNIITNDEACVHASGHPAQEDLKDLYKWIRPQILIPVHGEVKHMKAQANIGKKSGNISYTIIPHNGEVIELSKKQAPKIINKTRMGRWGLDGKYLIPLNTPHLAERKRLKDSGIAIITIVIDTRTCSLNSMHITILGIASNKLLKITKKNIYNALKEEIMNVPKNERNKIEYIKSYLHLALEYSLKNFIGKNPYKIIHLVQMNKK